MSDSLTNYRESYFQHPSLTKISGDPTYTSLAKLERECKANGKSVPTTLGGGAHGHLGLVSSAIAYERVSPGVTFDRPTPPVLPDLARSTVPQITEAHRLHQELQSIYSTCNLIERTITQQINTAIDDDCLADLIDEDTGLLQGTIPEIFAELYSTFGSITPQSLAVAKAKLDNTVYNHSRPIVNLFTTITEYANMADAANAAETSTQLINIGIIIITRSTYFASDIRKWNDKPIADKTWPNFKSHFKAAQRAIINSQPDITADSLGFHEQANAASIVDQVIDRLTTQHDAETRLTADSTAERIAEVQMANATQQNSTMLDQMQSLQTTIANLQTQVNTQHRSSGRGSEGRGRGRGRGGGRGGGRGNGRNSNGSFGPPAYCWTHGMVTHSSAECETQATGHISTATSANMQGGSTHRCHWLE
jgi:hypothetical protein